MTWGLQQRDLPILSPGQMNPWNQALQSGLETYQNINQAAYAPLKSQSDILSKAAYSAYTPASYAAKALSDPLVFASMTPQQRQNAIGMVSGMSNNPIEQMQNLFRGRGNTNKSASIWDSLKAKLELGEEQNVPQGTLEAGQMQGGMQPGMGGQPRTSSQFRTTNEVNQYPNIDLANPPSNMVESIPGIDLTSPGANKYNMDTGTPQGNIILANDPKTQSPQAKAAIDAYHERKKQEAIMPVKLDYENKLENIKSDNDLWKERIKDVGKTIDDSHKSLSTLKKMKNLYSNLSPYEKGIGFGSVKALSSNAQSFDQLAQNQATTNFRALQTGHITNTDFTIADKLKPGRWMNKDAFHTMEQFNEALALRAKQKQKFMSQAKQSGLPLAEADTRWADFIEENPLFDSKTNKIIKKDAAISPFNAPEKSSGQSQRQFKVINGTKYILGDDGEWYE